MQRFHHVYFEKVEKRHFVNVYLQRFFFFHSKSIDKLVFEALYFDIHEWCKNIDNPKLKMKRQWAKKVSNSVRKCSWNFAKLTVKHVCWILIFNKIVLLQLVLLFRKRLQHICFPINFAKFLRTPILENICERLLSCHKIL